MAQITIYLDQMTAKKLASVAAKRKLSVSRCIRDIVSKAINAQLPEGFPELYGALAELEIQRPEQTSFDHDTPRKPI